MAMTEYREGNGNTESVSEMEQFEASCVCVWMNECVEC